MKSNSNVWIDSHAFGGIFRQGKKLVYINLTLTHIYGEYSAHTAGMFASDLNYSHSENARGFNNFYQTYFVPH